MKNTLKEIVEAETFAITRKLKEEREEKQKEKALFDQAKAEILNGQTEDAVVAALIKEIEVKKGLRLTKMSEFAPCETEVRKILNTKIEARFYELAKRTESVSRVGLVKTSSLEKHQKALKECGFHFCKDLNFQDPLNVAEEKFPWLWKDLANLNAFELKWYLEILGL